MSGSIDSAELTLLEALAERFPTVDAALAEGAALRSTTVGGADSMAAPVTMI